MPWHLVFYTNMLLVIGIGMTALAFNLLWKRRAPESGPLALLMLATAAWSVMYALEIIAPDLQTKLMGAKLKYVGICLLPTSGLLFALRYTKRGKWLTPPYMTLLALATLIPLLFILTNDRHQLYWSYEKLGEGAAFKYLDMTNQIGFILYAVFSRGLIMFAALLFIIAFFRSQHVYRKQAGILVLSVLLPFGANAIYMVGLSPLHGVDLVPFGLVMTCLLSTWAIFRLRLADIIPIAQATIIEGMKDPVIVMDAENRIVKMNSAAEHLIGKSYFEVVGHSIQGAISNQADQIDFFLSETTAKREIEMGKSDVRRTYDASLSPMIDKSGIPLGKVAVLHDVTERNLMARELQKHRDELEELVTERTKKLEETQEQLRELSLHLQSLREDERIKIAREIHDDLGEALTALKMDASWLGKHLSEDQDTLREKIGAMLKLMDATIQSVRELHTDLRPGLLDDLGLVAAIEWQAEEFQKHTGIECAATITPTDMSPDLECSTAIFRIFQEAVTNVIRHAHATRITANLEEVDGQIVLTVIDNGRGIADGDVSKGGAFGLMGIRERVHALRGEMEISGIPGRGTTMTVTIPRGDR
jgi:PAS domain S-box-containing protein